MGKVRVGVKVKVLGPEGGEGHPLGEVEAATEGRPLPSHQQIILQINK